METRRRACGSGGLAISLGGCPYARPDSLAADIGEDQKPVRRLRGLNCALDTRQLVLDTGLSRRFAVHGVSTWTILGKNTAQAVPKAWQSGWCENLRFRVRSERAR